MALGAYQAETSRGNVLNALAHPNVVDPLGAMAKGYQAYNALAQVQQNQAQRAIGGILQQATDDNGNVDYGAATRMASQAGPVVQMGMQDYLKNAAALKSAQQQQVMNHMSTVGAAALTLVNDPSDANLAMVRTSMLNAGYPQGVVDQEIGTMQGMNADQRKAYALQHGLAAMDAGTRFNAAVGTTGVANMPQGAVPYVQRGAAQPGAGTMITAPGGVKAGVAPGETQTYTFQPIDAQGKPTGQPYQVTAPKGTVFPSMQGTQITPIPSTGSGGGGGGFPAGYTGRTPPNPNLANPNKPAVAPPSPAPAPAGGGGGDGSNAQPQTPTAPAAAPPAATPAPTAPAAAAPPLAGATPATSPSAAPAAAPASQPPGGGVATSVPMGTEETLKNDITARTDASAGARDQRNILQAGESAIEALRLAKGYTGPGTGTTSQMYAFLQAHDPTGALPQGDLSDTAWRQVLAKNLLRFAQNSGMRGNTDLGLTEQLKGSANVDQMLPAANEEVLLKDIGRQRQLVAQTALMPPASTSGDVVSHLKNYSANTDPRGFAWDLYDQKTRDAIEADAKKSGAAAVARLRRGIYDGIATGVTKPPQAASAPPAVTPPAVRPLVPTTGMVQPNALTPTNYAAAVPNALAA